jgi:hypothetical protein
MRKILNMLHYWVEILPLFIVRYLSKKYCERVQYGYENRIKRTFVTARPDVFFKLKEPICDKTL